MIKNKSGRRIFVRNLTLTGLGTSALMAFKGKTDYKNSNSESGKFKLSLNAYSFNEPLLAGTMTINDLIDYCSKVGFDAVDLTGYYFPGYPAVPADDLIYSVKKRAYNSGLEINATGVRNDLTWADAQKRAPGKKHIKEWIVVAQKLGAPTLRIFTGTASKEQYPWEERAKWIAEEIRECADFAKEHGIMLALQNHNDFLKNADQIEKLLRMINHEWVGLMLDIGSYHTADPYVDIERNAKYAISWQMKENIFINDKQVDTDYNKIIAIVRKCGFRGYLPLETLGEGDPYKKVEALNKKVAAIIKV
jgi:sugar phosphate isomerase/epimerase